jgi:hypothetical protein
MRISHGLRGGKIALTDGPFTESREIVGGYALVEAAARKKALDLATFNGRASRALA